MIDELTQFKLGIDPLINFLNWYEEATKIEDNADAMTLSTIDLNSNRPYSRTVLYKGLKNSNLLFFTNYLSQKGKQLDMNNEVSLLFYWHKSIRQVRIQGKVSRSDRETSINYFSSRDRDSQFASLISEQSTPINSKAALVAKLEEAKLKINENTIDCPLHWGGYLVEPYEFEFFIYGKNRLNDRFLFVKNENNTWSISRLQP